MSFTIPPGMTLEQMLVVMGQQQPEPAAEPEPEVKPTRKKPAPAEPEN
jgi:hypothetical protein